MSNSHAHIDDGMLVKYLLKECSPAEIALVERWIESGNDKLQYFTRFKLIWETSNQLQPDLIPDAEVAWRRLLERRESEKDKSKRPILTRMSWTRIAAILLPALVITTIFYLFNKSPNQSISIAATDAAITDTLPDGSFVTLNRSSSLEFGTSNGQNKRIAELKGEAFFKIKPDKSKPFIVKAGQVLVEVVGTSFNVKMKDSTVEVIVETGIVQVNVKGKQLELRKNQKVTIRPGDSLMRAEQEPDDLYSYYQSKTFVCNNTPLWKLVQTVNEAYNVNIVIGRDDIRNLPLTTTFHNESLEEILTVISETFGLQVAREEEKIILK